MIFHIAVCSPDPVLRGRVQRHCMEYYARRPMPASWSSWKARRPCCGRRKRAPGTSSTSLSCLPPTVQRPAGGCRAAPPGVCGPPLAFLAHTTAYAYEAFRVDAMQYLHIPFRPEQLTALLDRATEPEYGPVIPVATAMGLRALPFADIEYLECTHHVVHYHLAAARTCLPFSAGALFRVAKPLLADARFCSPTAPMWLTLPPPLSSPPGSSGCAAGHGCPSPGREPP